MLENNNQDLGYFSFLKDMNVSTLHTNNYTKYMIDKVLDIGFPSEYTSHLPEIKHLVTAYSSTGLRSSDSDRQLLGSSHAELLYKPRHGTASPFQKSNAHFFWWLEYFTKD